MSVSAQDKSRRQQNIDKIRNRYTFQRRRAREVYEEKKARNELIARMSPDEYRQYLGLRRQALAKNIAMDVADSLTGECSLDLCAVLPKKFVAKWLPRSLWRRLSQESKT